MNLKKHVLENGGATINRHMDVMDFNHGYQVSVRDICGVQLDTISPVMLYNMVFTLTGKLKDGEYVGLWLDKGICYIDKTELVEDLDKAIAVGRYYHQQGIYDWLNKETIRIG